MTRSKSGSMWTLESDEISVEINNLNTRLMEIERDESGAWIYIHALRGNFGFIVNSHTLMEHIQYTITCVDALKQLQTIYKMKLSTVNEVLPVTSFEISTPRFLSKSGSRVVIGNESSCFGHILSLKNGTTHALDLNCDLKKNQNDFVDHIPLLFGTRFLSKSQFIT